MSRIDLVENYGILKGQIERLLQGQTQDIEEHLLEESMTALRYQRPTY